MQAMKKMKKIRLIPLIALMLVIGATFFAGNIAYAADGSGDPSAKPAETLSVDEVWLTGDTLHIAVTDKSTGESQTLELNLKDYAKASDEYVTVQATNAAGSTSNSIQFKNPYYLLQESADLGDGTGTYITPGTNASESPVPDSPKAFTPDGTGSVVDNATDGDGKEFFTVETADGNVFYLIVDRQRASENVYLLNAVSENDLASLAKPGDGKSESAIPDGGGLTGTAQPTQAPTAETTPVPTLAPDAEKKGGISIGTIIFVIIAIAAVGGAGYYIKIVRPKKNTIDDAYDGEPDETAEEEYDSNEEDTE
jgi:flagellar basal body-associated protein FliL